MSHAHFGADRSTGNGQWVGHSWPVCTLYIDSNMGLTRLHSAIMRAYDLK